MDTTEEEWIRVHSVNLRGPWLICKGLLPSMIERGSGSLINIGSVTGLAGFPESTAYGSSKGGLVAFTKHMASELAQSGVRVNCICPGVIDTPGIQAWTAQMPDQEEAYAMLAASMPIGRLGRPEEVAAAALFFASEDSSFCQGSVLTVDGGFYAT